ncbi:hypothetical protein VTI74DRAFT_2390 [Chaetomium olivicolor]
MRLRSCLDTTKASHSVRCGQGSGLLVLRPNRRCSSSSPLRSSCRRPTLHARELRGDSCHRRHWRASHQPVAPSTIPQFTARQTAGWAEFAANNDSRRRLRERSAWQQPRVGNSATVVVKFVLPVFRAAVRNAQLFATMETRSRATARVEACNRSEQADL